MIEMVFAMLMIQNGTTIEYVPTAGMTDCLQQKRIVSRSIGEEQEGIKVWGYGKMAYEKLLTIV